MTSGMAVCSPTHHWGGEQTAPPRRCPGNGPHRDVDVAPGSETRAMWFRGAAQHVQPSALGFCVSGS